LFFDFIVGGYVEPWRPESQQQNAAVMRIVAAAAAGYAQAGYFTIVDGIFIPAWFFEPPRDTLVACGNQVVLRASLPICKTRCAGREKEPEADERVIEQLWSAFSDLGDLERHVLATDDAEPAEIRELIKRDLSRLLATSQAV
jgi:hypothetical protein